MSNISITVTRTHTASLPAAQWRDIVAATGTPQQIADYIDTQHPDRALVVVVDSRPVKTEWVVEVKDG